MSYQSWASPRARPAGGWNAESFGAGNADACEGIKKRWNLQAAVNGADAKAEAMAMGDWGRWKESESGREWRVEVEEEEKD